MIAMRYKKSKLKVISRLFQGQFQDFGDRWASCPHETWLVHFAPRFHFRPVLLPQSFAGMQIKTVDRPQEALLYLVLFHFSGSIAKKPTVSLVVESSSSFFFLFCTRRIDRFARGCSNNGPAERRGRCSSSLLSLSGSQCLGVIMTQLQCHLYRELCDTRKEEIIWCVLQARLFVMPRNTLKTLFRLSPSASTRPKLL